MVLSEHQSPIRSSFFIFCLLFVFVSCSQRPPPPPLGTKNLNAGNRATPTPSETGSGPDGPANPQAPVPSDASLELQGAGRVEGGQFLFSVTQEPARELFQVMKVTKTEEEDGVSVKQGKHYRCIDQKSKHQCDFSFDLKTGAATEFQVTVGSQDSELKNFGTETSLLYIRIDPANFASRLDFSPSAAAMFYQATGVAETNAGADRRKKGIHLNCLHFQTTNKFSCRMFLDAEQGSLALIE